MVGTPRATVRRASDRVAHRRKGVSSNRSALFRSPPGGAVVLPFSWCGIGELFHHFVIRQLGDAGMRLKMACSAFSQDELVGWGGGQKNRS